VPLSKYTFPKAGGNRGPQSVNNNNNNNNNKNNNNNIIIITIIIIIISCISSNYFPHPSYRVEEAAVSCQQAWGSSSSRHIKFTTQAIIVKGGILLYPHLEHSLLLTYAKKTTIPNK